MLYHSLRLISFNASSQSRPSPSYIHYDSREISSLIADAEAMYTETRSSRIRAAMFPESEAGPSSGVPYRSTIIEQVC